MKTLIVDFAPSNLLDKYSNSGEDPPHRPEPIRKVERIITSNGSALPGILIKLSLSLIDSKIIFSLSS